MLGKTKIVFFLFGRQTIAYSMNPDPFWKLFLVFSNWIANGNFCRFLISLKSWLTLISVFNRMFLKSIFYSWFLCFLVTAELGGILQMPWLAWVPGLGKQTFFILIQCKFFFAELGKTSIFLREKYLKGWQILPFDIQFFIFKVQSN